MSEETASEDVSGSGSSSWSLIKFLDDNIRYIQYPFFVVGIAGAVLIARSVRLGTKFTSLNEIPEEFFRKNFTLYGRVEQVKKYDGGEQSILLFVDHMPIFTFSKHTPNAQPLLSHCLPLMVPGVTLKSHYFPELYKKLDKQKVSFTLLQDNSPLKDAAMSLVFVRALKWKIFPHYENVGLWCVQNGYATSAPVPYPSALRDSPKFGSYYAQLLKLEGRASKKGKGLWEQKHLQRNRFFTLFKNFLKWWKNR